MRIGTSRADRIGFVVFAVLAGLLAVLVVSNLDNEPSESAQSVNTFADVAPPQAVPTTAALTMPTATPSPEPLAFAPLAEPEADEDDDGEAAESDASTADGEAADEGTSESPSAGQDAATTSAAPVADTTTEASAEAAAAASAAPNPQPAATTVPNPQPSESAVPNPQPAAGDGEGTTPNPQPAASAVPNPQPASGANTNVAAPAAAPATIPPDAPVGGTFTHTLTATVSRPTLYNAPGGQPFTPTFNGTALPAVNPTVFGNALVYRVLAGEPGAEWAKVYVPARPNGTTAWVQTSQFRWGSSNRMIQINVSNNTVTVYEGSNVLLTTQAVTGKSSSPTPRANGWVEEIMAGPSSAYGPRLISLGIYSDALNSFGGSVPKIALHGTNNPGLMGQYASNGCIRVRNEIITQIAGMVTPGSKVVIVG